LAITDSVGDTSVQTTFAHVSELKQPWTVLLVEHCSSSCWLYLTRHFHLFIPVCRLYATCFSRLCWFAKHWTWKDFKQL